MKDHNAAAFRVRLADLDQARLERIATARKALADRHAADPEGVQRFNLKMARLATARKHEQQRLDHLVFGKDRPKPPKANARKGRRKAKPATTPLAPGVEEAVQLRERWSHKSNATPETMEAASRTHQGALAQLYKNGTIDAEQLEWAAQIANVHRSIESDVAVRVASLEARVDNSHRGGEVEEGIRRVRMHLAYTYWREELPAPKRLILDMIVGEPIGFTVAAKRYRVHNRKAKRLLLDAIDHWPECVVRAQRAVPNRPG